LGALFRSAKTSKVKRNLMVFIRATVIKDPDKARIMSMNKYNFMRDLQLESVGEEAVGPLLVPYE
jgi:general secretion pathway protein D